MLPRRVLLLGGLGLVAAGQANAQAARTAARGKSQPRLFTAPQIEGPFYPYDTPRVHDADLVRISTDDAPALGQVVHLRGKVMRADGRPLAEHLVEIWQCDANGRYIHPDDDEPRPRDPHFQGYGRTLTDKSGDFAFRTIRPVSYRVGAILTRAPHVHMAVSSRGVRRLTTQLYVEGEPLNDGDSELARIPALLRPGLIRPYVDGGAIERGSQTVHYGIVLL
jgi:protocatechuate 3,4-dioxygenase beta subunit